MYYRQSGMDVACMYFRSERLHLGVQYCTMGKSSRFRDANSHVLSSRYSSTNKDQIAGVSECQAALGIVTGTSPVCLLPRAIGPAFNGVQWR